LERPLKDKRSAELAKIHIWAKQIGLADDAYREMLEAVAGARSAADLDAAGRRAVLGHLRSCGAKAPAANPARVGTGPKSKIANPKSKIPYPGRPKNMDGEVEGKAAYLKKIEAYLAEAGRPWKYVDSMARRMFGVDAVSWLNEDQLRRLMLALKYDAKRHGRDL